MKLISILKDDRIKSNNVLIEFEIHEYIEIAAKILENNPFQRRRVKSSSTVYSLLREDLKSGCVIPPIVLAISKDIFYLNPSLDPPGLSSELEKFIRINIPHIIIIDGLQRTYNVIDANDELIQIKDLQKLSKYHSGKLRCEFYLGIDRIGILYRMLTLNTGQTPMSLRHQIEILYSDYLNHAIDGIRLIRETEDIIPRKLGEYSFKEIIEGFTSYLMRDYLTFDKSDVLSNIKSLEKLSKENQEYDIFQNFIKSYHNFQIKIQKLIGNWQFNYEEFQTLLSGPVFGTNAYTIFNRSQPMTGLGAAEGFLLDQELITGFEDVILNIEQIYFTKEVETTMVDLLFKLDDIRKNAPKIGNAQRAYFFYFFRELFNKQGDSFLKVDVAIENAFKRYRQNA